MTPEATLQMTLWSEKANPRIRESRRVYPIGCLKCHEVVPGPETEDLKKIAGRPICPNCGYNGWVMVEKVDGEWRIPVHHRMYICDILQLLTDFPGATL